MTILIFRPRGKIRQIVFDPFLKCCKCKKQPHLIKKKQSLSIKAATTKMYFGTKWLIEGHYPYAPNYHCIDMDEKEISFFCTLSGSWVSVGQAALLKPQKPQIVGRLPQELRQ